MEKSTRNGNANSHPIKKNSALYENFIEFIWCYSYWILVVGFILPASFIFDIYLNIRDWLALQLGSGVKGHDKKVALIQKQIREWHKSGSDKKLCTARSSYLTMSFRCSNYKKNMVGIPTNTLKDILHLDKEKMTLRVEPMVTMGQLTRYLNPLGYTLPVVPEFEELTIGGVVNGGGIESSSFKYGLFQHNCLSYEIVMPNGELILASKEPNSEHEALFYGISWSHGTLGFLVAATIQIIPAKKYVQLTYFPFYNQKDITQKLRSECEKSDKNDFLEGIQYTKETGIVMVGRFTDNIPINDDGKLNILSRWYKPWFFKHVEQFLYKSNKQQSYVEYIPIRDYYHRHSRSIFFEIRDIIPFGNNLLFRILFGWAMPPKVSLLKMTMPKTIKNISDKHHMLKDMLVPFENTEETVNLLDKEVKVYPVWLCAFNLPSEPGIVRNATGKDRLYIDVGAYGNPTQETYHPIETIRRLENYLRSVEGLHILCFDCYQTPSEFWQMFDSKLYNSLRTKYECVKALPNIYEKVCRTARD